MLEIITPATSRRLTTLDMARRVIGLEVGDTSFDVQLASLIDQASAAAESWTARVFATEEVEETFELARPRFRLQVSRFPVNSVTALTIEGFPWDNASDVRIANAGHLYRGTENSRYAWPDDTPITVRYRGGFVLPGFSDRNLPHDIERAVLLAIAAYWRGEQRDPLVKSERVAVEGVEDVQTTYGMLSTSLPQEAQALLAPYRRVVL